MYNNDLKDKYKHLAPETLVGYGLLDEAKNSGYVCPFCGNGRGDDGTGIDFDMLKDGFEGYCHRCHEHFDVFKIIGCRENLSTADDFPKIFERAREIFGDIPTVTAQKPKEKKIKNFDSLIKKSWTHLDEFLSRRGGFWRGLTLETLKKFGCGYLPDWMDNYNDYAHKTYTPRVIIPTSYHHYLARYVDDSVLPNIPAGAEFKNKPHAGTKEIFGKKLALNELSRKKDLLVFAVEGEIDAMSVWQCGFVAIAFSGSDIAKYQLTLLKDFPAGTKFILMLDNDDTGRKQSPTVEKKLTDCGFKVCPRFLEGNFSDFNAWLQADSDGLCAELKKIYDSATFEENIPPDTAQKNDTGISADSDGDTSKKIISSCPIDLKIPDNFKFTSRGLYFGKNNELVTHTPPVPVRLLRKVDGSDTQIDLAFYNKNNFWEVIRVKQVEIARSQDIVNLAARGFSITSGRAKFLSNFLTDIQNIADNPQKIPHTLIFEQTGWTDDTCEKFIYPPGDEKFIVQHGGFDYAGAFSTRGNKSDWLKIFAESYEKSVGIRYVIGLACAAPLVRLCKTANFQGVLISPSGSGKSAIAKLATSIFGNPEKFHQTLNATGNFVDDLAPKFNDLFCWVDEFQSADQKLRENFQTVIFNYAEGKTRGKLKRNSEAMTQYEFKGTRILTSEENILRENYTQGAYKRLIEFQANSLLDDKLAVKIHHAVAETFGHFGRGYIDWIIAHKDSIREYYAEIPKYAGWKKLNPTHVSHLALVYAGLQTFVEFLRATENFSVEYDPLSYCLVDMDFWNSILTEVAESNNAIRVLNFIDEIRDTHEKNFNVEVEVSGQSSIVKATLSPIYGTKFKNGDVALYPLALRNLLRENNYPHVTSIMRDMAAQNLILSKNSDAHKYQYQTRLDESGYTKWCYYFPAASFEDNT